MFRRDDGDLLLLRIPHDGTAKRMLRVSFGTGGCFEQRMLRNTRRGAESGDQRDSVGQSAGFVEENGVELPECLQIDPALDDRAMASCTSDGSQDRERCTRSD